MESLKNLFYFIKDFGEDTAENIRETTVTAVDSAKLRYRITAQRNEINAMYASLGRKLYCENEGASSFELTADEVDEICKRIRLKNEILKGLERQLRVVSGKVICPSCGRFMSEKYSYCPYCGKRITTVFAENEELGIDVTAEELDLVREIDDI